MISISIPKKDLDFVIRLDEFMRQYGYIPDDEIYNSETEETVFTYVDEEDCYIPPE